MSASGQQEAQPVATLATATTAMAGAAAAAASYPEGTMPVTTAAATQTKSPARCTDTYSDEGDSSSDEEERQTKPTAHPSIHDIIFKKLRRARRILTPLHRGAITPDSFFKARKFMLKVITQDLLPLCRIDVHDDYAGDLSTLFPELKDALHMLHGRVGAELFIHYTREKHDELFAHPHPHYLVRFRDMVRYYWGHKKDPSAIFSSLCMACRPSVFKYKCDHIHSLSRKKIQGLKTNVYGTEVLYEDHKRGVFYACMDAKRTYPLSAIPSHRACDFRGIVYDRPIPQSVRNLTATTGGSTQDAASAAVAPKKTSMHELRKALKYALGHLKHTRKPCTPPDVFMARKIAILAMCKYVLPCVKVRAGHPHISGLWTIWPELRTGLMQVAKGNMTMSRFLLSTTLRTNAHQATNAWNMHDPAVIIYTDKFIRGLIDATRVHHPTTLFGHMCTIALEAVRSADDYMQHVFMVTEEYQHTKHERPLYVNPTFYEHYIVSTKKPHGRYAGDCLNYEPVSIYDASDEEEEEEPWDGLFSAHEVAQYRRHKPMITTTGRPAQGTSTIPEPEYPPTEEDEKVPPGSSSSSDGECSGCEEHKEQVPTDAGADSSSDAEEATTKPAAGARAASPASSTSVDATEQFVAVQSWEAPAGAKW